METGNGNKKTYCTAVVLAAGKGRRMGSETAKQYLEIDGRPIVVYALEAFQKSLLIDEIILMTDEQHTEYCRKKIVEAYGLSKVSAVRAGGKERYESVWKALCVILEKREAEEKCIWEARQEGYVFIHDGARPFISENIIGRAYEAVKRWNACVVGMPVKDTIKLVDRESCITGSPDRSLIWQAQTPQVFSVPLITEAFRKQLKEDCSLVTDDAMVVERQMGIRVHMTEGSYENIKITTPEDLDVAEAFAKRRSKSTFEKNKKIEKNG